MIRKVLAGGLVAVALLVSVAQAAEPRVFSTSEGAIRGYDPVAYFTEGKPVRGSDDFTFDWHGATFKFAHAAHLAEFKSGPEKYAPRYGGYCAYAVSEGYTASTVPEAWTIHEGRLYLNYSVGVQERWEADIPARVAAGDANWPGVLE